jgi:hypothetical protein
MTLFSSLPVQISNDDQCVPFGSPGQSVTPARPQKPRSPPSRRAFVERYSSHQFINAAHLHVQLPHSFLDLPVGSHGPAALNTQLLRGWAVMGVELTQGCVEGVDHTDGNQVTVALSLGQLRQRDAATRKTRGPHTMSVLRRTAQLDL